MAAKHIELTKRFEAMQIADAAHERLPEELKAIPAIENISKAAMYDAQALYLRYTPIMEIERQTGINADMLRYHIYKPMGWKEQREMLSQEVKAEVKQSTVKQLREATNKSVKIIAASLDAHEDELRRSGQKPTLAQGERVSKIFARLHNAKMAEEYSEMADSIESLSPEEVLDALTSDPYLSKAIEARQNVIDEADEVFEVEEQNLEPVTKDSASLADINRPKI